MKKKMIGFIIIIMILFCLIVMFFSKLYYGNFNVFSYPTQVYFFGRNYYCTKENIKTIKDENKPQYEITTIFNKLTGKKFYIQQQKINGYDPQEVYLYLGDDKYGVFVISGGA